MSAAAVLAWTLLMAGATAALFWQYRPEPTPWHDVGADRMRTPAIDYADAQVRWMLRHAADEAGDPRLADECGLSSFEAPETYVLTRVGTRPGSSRQTRVTLTDGGELLHSRWDPRTSQSVARRRVPLTGPAGERFRDLLIDGGFLQMPVADRFGSCHAEWIALESCVRGRYYAVFRACHSTAGEPSLHDLADAIEAYSGD